MIAEFTFRSHKTLDA